VKWGRYYNYSFGSCKLPRDLKTNKLKEILLYFPRFNGEVIGGEFHLLYMELLILIMIALVAVKITGWD
jgi:hypothetical protein